MQSCLSPCPDAWIFTSPCCYFMHASFLSLGSRSLFIHASLLQPLLIFPPYWNGKLLSQTRCYMKEGYFSWATLLYRIVSYGILPDRLLNKTKSTLFRFFITMLPFTSLPSFHNPEYHHPADAVGKAVHRFYTSEHFFLACKNWVQPSISPHKLPVCVRKVFLPSSSSPPWEPEPTKARLLADVWGRHHLLHLLHVPDHQGYKRTHTPVCPQLPTKKLLLAHHLSHSRALFTPIALKQERLMLAPLPSIPSCSS